MILKPSKIKILIEDQLVEIVSCFDNLECVAMRLIIHLHSVIVYTNYLDQLKIFAPGMLWYVIFLFYVTIFPLTLCVCQSVSIACPKVRLDASSNLVLPSDEQVGFAGCLATGEMNECGSFSPFLVLD